MIEFIKYLKNRIHKYIMILFKQSVLRDIYIFYIYEGALISTSHHIKSHNNLKQIFINST